ncbi:MAG: hypothetical protein AAF517_20900, partial [Planctomycetota bacterium]
LARHEYERVRSFEFRESLLYWRALDRLSLLDDPPAFEPKGSVRDPNDRPPSVPSGIADAAMRDVFKEFFDTARERKSFLEDFEALHREAVEEAECVDGLLDDLREVGGKLPKVLPAKDLLIDGTVEEAGGSSARVGADVVGRYLTERVLTLSGRSNDEEGAARFRQHVREYITEYGFERALRAAADGDLDRSRRWSQQVLSVDPEHVAAAELAQALGQWSRSTVIALAGRRLFEFRRGRVASLRRELYSRFARADAASRRDLAIRELDAAMRKVEWAAAAVRADPEVSRLVEILDVRFVTNLDRVSEEQASEAVVAARSGRFLRRLRSWRRTVTTDYVSKLEAWIDAVERGREPRKGRNVVPGSPVWRLHRRYSRQITALRADPNSQEKVRKLACRLARLEEWYPGVEDAPR